MISAFLIVKNEAHNLPDCLRSLEWADEIVVVDSGSEDATLACARRFTDRVFERPFTNFADQKNFALSLVHGEWAFSIDADERIPTPLRDEILATVAAPSSADAYRVPRRAYFRGQWMRTFYPDFQIRLIRAGRGRFVGEVHETVVVDGELGELREPLDHFSAPTVGTFLRKIRRYASADARKRRAGGESFPPRSVLIQPLRELRRLLLVQKAWRDGANGVLVSTLMAAYEMAVAFHGWRGSPAPVKAPATEGRPRR